MCPRDLSKWPNQEAVLIGDLEKNSEAMKVVMPKLNKEIFLYASVP